MQAKIEIITPSYAKQLLAQGIKNRPISEAAVLRYARDMAEGRWQSNGQGIVLTEAGMLLDGQHRMHAVIRADVPVGMLVVRGVQQETFVTIDSGRARKLQDVLSIDGYRNANQLAASARQAYNYIVGSHLRQSPTKSSLRDFVADYPYLSEIGNHIFQRSGKGPIRRLSTSMASVMFIANSRHRYDPEVMEFHDAVVSGQDLSRGDPRFALREWIINHSTKGSHVLPQNILFSAVGRAWNAYAEGRALITIRPESDPSRASMPLIGFERAFFQKVEDVPQAPAFVQPKGRNTRALLGPAEPRVL